MLLVELLQLEHEYGPLLALTAQLIADIGVTQRLQIKGAGKSFFNPGEAAGFEKAGKIIERCRRRRTDFLQPGRTGCRIIYCALPRITEQR